MSMTPAQAAAMLAAQGAALASRMHPFTDPVTILVPIRTVSELNAHAHWRGRQRRAKEQRMAVSLAFRRIAAKPTLPVVVTLTRIAPRKLDDDNLCGAPKHVRDQVAAEYGVDDGSDLYTWRYAQERGEPGVRIEFAERGQA